MSHNVDEFREHEERRQDLIDKGYISNIRYIIIADGDIIDKKTYKSYDFAKEIADEVREFQEINGNLIGDVKVREIKVDI